MQLTANQLRTAAMRDHQKRMADIHVMEDVTDDERRQMRIESDARLDRDLTAARAREVVEAIKIPAELALIETELQIENCMNLTEGHAARVWRGAR